MNKDEYLKQFSKALKGLPRAVREEIVREMRGNLQDFNDEENSLEAHFGAPESLAQSYMRGMESKPSRLARVPGYFRNLMAVAGGIFVLLFVTVLTVGWFIKDDRFNYADANAAIRYFDKTAWMRKKIDKNFRITGKQSAVVVHWHDEPSVSYQCKGKKNALSATELTMLNSFCVVFLPEKNSSDGIDFDVFQAALILVQPQVPLTVKAARSAVRIAEGGNRYRYNLKESRSKWEDLESDDDAPVTINIDAYQSSIRKYEHD